jgi:large subunit ribosomal protein L19
MSQELLNHVASGSMKKKVPVLKAGNVVRVHQKIKEGGKERVQIFEGLVIKISSGSGVNKTFTVRKMVGGIGVEKIFPFFSPNIKQIDIVKDGKVRRSKLYYMRERTGKSARLRDQGLGEIEMVGEDEVVEEPEAEEAAPESKEAPAPETAPAEVEEAPAKEENPADEAETPPAEPAPEPVAEPTEESKEEPEAPEKE